MTAPLTAALYLAAAVLTVWGAFRAENRLPAFGGGLLWAAGTVSALVEGASLEAVLTATLVMLLASTGVWRRGRP